MQRLVQQQNPVQPPTPDLAVRIQAAAGGGWSIDRKARRKLERGLDAKLDHVRVHDDTAADAMARAVGATAFTTGSDIFFRQGAYQPGSREGMRLLAHEASHVVQQAAGGVDGKLVGGLSVSHPSDRFEQAADANAERLMAGKIAASRTSTRLVPSEGRPIQRRSDTEILDLVGTGVSAGGTVAPSFDPWGIGGSAMGGFGNLLDRTAGLVQKGTLEAAQLNAAKSTLGTAGSIFSLGSGISGMSAANNTSEFIAPAISTVSGGVGLVGGIAGMGGATSGLATLGPLGAAIGMGGGLGALGGAGLWELEKMAKSGTSHENASEYERGSTDENGVYTPPTDWALEKQNKIDAAWNAGGLGVTDAAYHGAGLGVAGIFNGLLGVGELAGLTNDPGAEDWSRPGKL